ncbi:hypothetical protein BH11ACT7_BH11ACT7_01870 [soil metagenome]
MTKRRTLAAVWLGSGLWYLAAEAISASMLPGYRYWVAYISDLGVPGHSPGAGWMNSGFVVQGVGFAVGAALVFTTVRRSRVTAAFLALALIYGIDCVVVGVIHGGGTGADSVAHIAGATAAIVGGNLALIVGGAELLRRGRRTGGLASAVLGVAGLLSAVILVRPGIVGTVSVGGWERGAVYTIIGWQLAVGVVVALTGRRQSTPA